MRQTTMVAFDAVLAAVRARWPHARLETREGVTGEHDLEPGRPLVEVHGDARARVTLVYGAVMAGYDVYQGHDVTVVRVAGRQSSPLERMGGVIVEVVLVALLGRCEYCWGADGVAWESSRTCYDDGLQTMWPFLNRQILCCRPCAEDHHAYWDERWQEYNDSRG